MTRSSRITNPFKLQVKHVSNQSEPKLLIVLLKKYNGIFTYMSKVFSVMKSLKLMSQCATCIYFSNFRTHLRHISLF